MISQQQCTPIVSNSPVRQLPYLAILLGLTVGSQNVWAGDPVAGKNTYLNNCANCHAYPSSNNIVRSAANNAARITWAIANNRGGMGSLANAFSTAQLDDMASYIGATLSDTVPPSVPTGLTATPASPTQIKLSWTAATDNIGVTAYKVYINGNLIGSSAGTSPNINGLSASTSYSFAVSACDAAGNCSAQSATLSATTPAATSTTAALSVNDCLFNWLEDKYPVYISPSRQTSQTSSPYFYRYYPATGSYAGVSSTDSHLYYLSKSTGLVDLGLAATWTAQAGCK